MSSLTRRFLFLTLWLSAFAGAPAAMAQAWPAKPITMVVSYPAGGDTDAIARLYAEKLSTRLGQPVVVDNRPGASGMIGDRAVANASPEGYTFLMTTNQFASAHHVVQAGPAVARNPVADFTPVVETGHITLILVTSPGTGIKDAKQLVAQAKGGRSLSYGSPGVGSPMHFVGEMLNKAAGIHLSHVAYKGVNPSVTDALGGHVDLVWATPGTVAAHVASGKLIALAVSDPQRSKLFPSVPTLVELGYPVQVTAWMGILGPKGVSPEVVGKLNSHMNEILKMPDVVAKMANLGVVPDGGEPTKLGRQVAEDDKLFGTLAKEFGIRAD
jgi:tripartite-type tricarboxylate transporter receptor subunit TctC